MSKNKGGFITVGYVVAILYIFSIIYAIITGNIENVSSSVFESAASAVQLTLTLCGVMAFWCGIMSVLEKKGIIKKLSRAVSPVLRLLFPTAYKNGACGEISANISANILGIGNAATPMGLSAMSRLHRLNGGNDSPSDDMVMLVVLNTASLDIFPATLIALRQSAGSQAPYSIVLPTVISSLITVVFAVAVTKLLSRVF